MPDDLIIYDRNVLYEEVWAEPMRDVAKRYGVSGVALAKMCRRLEVPVPGRGHWAKVKVGKADERSLLPALGEGERDRIAVRRRDAPPREEPLRGLENAVPVTLAEPIVVPEVLDSPHPLVALSARYLQKAHPEDGVVSAPTRSCLDICVAPTSLDRALRICDALIKAVEAAGLTVEVAAIGAAEPARPSYYAQHEREPQPPERITRVLCDHEWIEFCLTERVRRIEDKGPPSADELPHVRESRAYTHEPTGELALRLTNVDEPGVRIKWQDTKRQRLEQMLDALVSYLSTVALAFKLKREADEQAALAVREAEQRRYEEEEREREEVKREQALESEVARWRRAQDIRDYVRAALEALGEADVLTDDGSSLRNRLRWAAQYADRLDPFKDCGGA